MKKNILSEFKAAKFSEELLGDSSYNNTQRFIPNVSYSLVKPSPVKNPELIAISEDVKNMLGINNITNEHISLLSGNLLTNNIKPFSARYAGHQFGVWASQLGDGRAITLAEVNTPDNRSFEVQLKGAGLTPYSRRGDGRAVLRSSLREFLCSEAMYYLGIPSTRALSLVLTGEDVVRDMFYDGNAKAEPGAIVSRVSPTFIRFGNFEVHSFYNEIDSLKKLYLFTLKNYYPELYEGDNITDSQCMSFYQKICKRTIDLIIDWLRVGFVHGVMNTDNMSIIGETIDYGPYGWLEKYNPSWTPNTTDFSNRRYAYGNQAQIAFWNLSILGEALKPLVSDNESFNNTLDNMQNYFNENYLNMLGRKFGFDRIRDKADKDFIFSSLSLMELLKADFTNFFRKLSELQINTEDNQSDNEIMKECFYLENNEYKAKNNFINTKFSKNIEEEFDSWIKNYKKRISLNSISEIERIKIMNSNNPAFVLRNYLTYGANDELMKGERNLFDNILKAMKEPYTYIKSLDYIYKNSPSWAFNTSGCSTLSCSS